MNITLKLADEAIADYEDAVAWYNEQKAGLGFDFSVRVMEAFEKIETNPTGQQFLYKDRRCTRLKHFPYKIYFLLNELEQSVLVFAILHDKRHPDTWKSRSEQF